MANLNRDYLVTLDVKTSNVTLSSPMTFYVTDRRTMNIFVKLVINMSNNPLLQKHVALENATDYRVEMVLVAPNKEPFFLRGQLLDEAEALFSFNLTEDQIDKVGNWVCELRVYSTVEGEEEIITSKSFLYSVNRSITTDLNDEVLDTTTVDILDSLLGKFASLEEDIAWLYEHGGGGGGTGGGSGFIAYLSTTDNTDITAPSGTDIDLHLDFYSPNMGRGTLKVSVDDVDVMTKSVSQGESVVTISEDLLHKGINTVKVYAIDRAGTPSNTLTFTVRYGSTELVTTFDPEQIYDPGTAVRYYFTATALDTSETLKFYMKIDGVTQDSLDCTSDVRTYFTFPVLSIGAHRCEAWVEDSYGKSNVIEFYFIVLDNTSLAVTSTTTTATIEEGAQLSLDYKAYMKGTTRFITETYVDNNLVNTGECGADTNYYRTSSLGEGQHTIKIVVYDTTKTISDEITWAVTVTASTYQAKQPLEAGALAMFTAQDRTNSDQNRGVWTGKDQAGNTLTANLENFSFDSDSGWNNDELIISGKSAVEIPIAPLSNNARFGFTLDVEFTSKQIGVEDAEVLTLWNDTDNCCIKITTERLILRSKAGNECNLFFSDNENVSAMFIIDRDEKTAKIYLNGVMCSAFTLSDYTVSGQTYLEDFTVNGNIVLGGGTNKNGYCKIKNLRVYEVALTTNEILDNWLSNIRDKEAQKEMADFQKGDDLPTLTVYCDFAGLGKDDKKPCDIVYSSPDVSKYGESFSLMGKTSQLQYQGTSSMQYPIKNYRLNLRDAEGEKWYYNPYGEQGGKPECRFTLKADFMSSGHWQNTGLAKFVSDKLYNYKTNNAATMNPGKWHDLENGGTLKDTRDSINGFPCRLILVNDGDSPLNEGQQEPLPGNTKDMGIFNFNNDKDNVGSLGLDIEKFPNCISYEVAANSDTSAGAFVPYDGADSEGELAYLQASFELRYPDADDYGADYGYLTSLKRVVDWVGNCTDEEFVAHYEEYFDKHYLLRYYLLVITLGMVDNLGKNMMFDTWDGQIWYPRFYDMDTICSYDNSGAIKFDVDIEMAQGYWNTSASRLWVKVRDLLHNELVEAYKDMRGNGLNYEGLMNYFYGEQIAKIPQKYYNQDYDVKYAPYSDEYLGKAHGDGYEHLKRWLKNRLIFVDTLFDYGPSYESDMLTIRANTLEPITFEIETYSPLYQHVSYYNGQMSKLKVDGKVATTFTGHAQTATDQEILIYGGTNIKRIRGISSANPDSMLIGGATKLVELDISDCPILTEINSNKANLSPHTYLSKADLSGCTQLSGNLRIDNSSLIRELDLRDTAITGINFPPNAKNLEVLQLPETLKELSLKGTSLLNNLELPANLEYLSLVDTPGLSNIVTTSCDKITTLVMEKVGNNPFTLMGKMPNLEFVRLIDIDTQTSTDNVQKLLTFQGLDASGNVIPIAQAVSGTIRLVTCSEELEAELKELFPRVTFSVLSYVQSYTVNFIDGDSNVIYTTKVLTNGMAIYAGPTPTKTSTAQYNYEWTGWSTSFGPILGNTTITATFKSILRYYDIRFIDGTTMEVISSGSYAYGTTPTAPAFPDGTNMWAPGLTIVTESVDYISKYAPYPEDLNTFNFVSIYNSENAIIGYRAYLKASSSYPVQVPANLIFPFEYNGKPVLELGTTSAPNSAYMSDLENVYVPETVTKIYGPVLRGAPKLTSVTLPESVREIKGNVFSNCTKLQSVIAPGCQVMGTESGNGYGLGCFSGCSGLQYVVLGSAKYPFKKVVTASSSSGANPFYDCSTLKYANLVTENGLESDVEFNAYHTATTVNYIFSKAPLYPETHNGLMCVCDGEEYKVMALLDTNATDITIPDKINGVPVTTIMKRVFYNKPNITHIRGMGEIKTIEENAIYTSTQAPYNLTTVGNVEGEINLPKLERIDNYGLDSVQLATAVDLPNVKYIGDYGLAYLRNATRINIPRIEYIGRCGVQYAGYNLYSSIELSEMPELSEVSEGGYQFYTSYIDKLIAPKLTNIPVGFAASASYCSYVEVGSPEYPVTTIYGYTGNSSYCAFGYLGSQVDRIIYIVTENGSVNDITFTGSGTVIGDATYIKYVKEIAIDVTDGDWVLKVYSDHVELSSYNENATDLVLPSTYNGKPVTKVLQSACINKALQTLTIPDSITELEPYAFNGCQSLIKITGGINITTVGISCFETCPNLKTIGSTEGTLYLPKATELGNRAFLGCSFETANLPELTIMGEYAFSGQKKIKTVDIPKVITIGRNAFSNCTLVSINMPNVETIGAQAFNYCTNLTSVLTLPKLTTLGSSAFAGAWVSGFVLPKLTTAAGGALPSSTRLLSVQLGDVGSPITNTSGFDFGLFSSTATATITIYTVDGTGNGLTGSPWGATNCTIVYEQA